MAGDALVQRQRFQRGDRPRITHRHVEEQDARRHAIGRTGAIIASAALPAQGRQRCDLERSGWPAVEQARHGWPDAGFDLGKAGDELFLGLAVEFRIGTDMFEQRFQVTRPAKLLSHGFEFTADAGHFCKAKIMNGLRRHRDGGVALQLERIKPVSILRCRSARANRRGRQIATGEKVPPARIGGQHRSLDQAHIVRLPA